MNSYRIPKDTPEEGITYQIPCNISAYNDLAAQIESELASPSLLMKAGDLPDHRYIAQKFSYYGDVETSRPYKQTFWRSTCLSSYTSVCEPCISWRRTSERCPGYFRKEFAKKELPKLLDLLSSGTPAKGIEFDEILKRHGPFIGILIHPSDYPSWAQHNAVHYLKMESSHVVPSGIAYLYKAPVPLCSYKVKELTIARKELGDNFGHQVSVVLEMIISNRPDSNNTLKTTL